MNRVVYFEFNNWFCGQHYPCEEPFISWMSSDINIKFRDEKWVKENKLCVVFSFIDMSQNFCITAPEEWVIDNCPKLLTDFTQFLRHEDEDGNVYGQWGNEFLDYKEENFGIIEEELYQD